MTVILKKSDSKEKMEKIFESVSKSTQKNLKTFDAHKYCGILKLKKSPLEIQKQMRDEWE